MGKIIRTTEPDGFPLNTTGDASRPESFEDERGARKNQPASGNATGPRTELGKKNSSQNAIKFGLFSRATLLKGESRTEYNSLLKGLRETFQPEGKLEEILVEKLVTSLWRYQRLLTAEGAEIRKNIEFPEMNGTKRQVGIGMEIFKSQNLISRVHDPNVLERCLESLVELRQGIEASGFDEERDSSILTTIYGAPDKADSNRIFQDEYLEWLQTSKATEKERKRGGYAAVDECEQNVVREIGFEIKRLKENHRKQESIKSERRMLEILRQGVPDSPAADRMLRYEASLERSFDRTLTQLERVQRVRKGQPLPPQLDVKIF